MATLGERAQAKFSQKAARYGTPVTLSDRAGAVRVFPEEIPPGSGEYLPDGPRNAADAAQWKFYGSSADFPAPPAVGTTIIYHEDEYVIYRAPRPHDLQGCVVYWTIYAYLAPADSPDAATDPQAQAWADPPDEQE